MNLMHSTEYPLLPNKAVNILLPFATTYLCETAFSALTNMKTKYRSRLVVESDMRVCLSNITPRIDSLCKAKQAHLSHLTLFAFHSIHSNLHIIDDVGLFVKSSVLKNFSILQLILLNKCGGPPTMPEKNRGPSCKKFQNRCYQVTEIKE